MNTANTTTLSLDGYEDEDIRTPGSGTGTYVPKVVTIRFHNGNIDTFKAGVRTVAATGGFVIPLDGIPDTESFSKADFIASALAAGWEIITLTSRETNEDYEALSKRNITVSLGPDRERWFIKGEGANGKPRNIYGTTKEYDKLKEMAGGSMPHSQHQNLVLIHGLEEWATTMKFVLATKSSTAKDLFGKKNISARVLFEKTVLAASNLHRVRVQENPNATARQANPRTPRRNYWIELGPKTEIDPKTKQPTIKFTLVGTEKKSLIATPTAIGLPKLGADPILVEKILKGESSAQYGNLDDQQSLADDIVLNKNDAAHTFLLSMMLNDATMRTLGMATMPERKLSAEELSLALYIEATAKTEGWAEEWATSQGFNQKDDGETVTTIVAATQSSVPSAAALVGGFH